MANEETPSELSKYNEAALQIMRLNGLWIKFESHLQENEFFYMEKTLDSIWLELYADAVKKNKDYYLLAVETIDRSMVASENRGIYLKRLKFKASFMKRLQDVVGKGGVYQDGNESNFE